MASHNTEWTAWTWWSWAILICCSIIIGPLVNWWISSRKMKRQLKYDLIKAEMAESQITLEEKLEVANSILKTVKKNKKKKRKKEKIDAKKRNKT